VKRHGGMEDGGFAPSAPIRPTNPDYALVRVARYELNSSYALVLRVLDVSGEAVTHGLFVSVLADERIFSANKPIERLFKQDIENVSHRRYYSTFSARAVREFEISHGKSKLKYLPISAFPCA
jgi:hypothetical protein